MPLDGQLLYRSGTILRLQELEKEIVAWLQSMQLRAQQQKTRPPNPNEPPITQQDAQIYSTLHGILGQVQQKYRDVEVAMQRSRTAAPASFLDDDAEPGQQQQAADPHAQQRQHMDTTQQGHAANNQATHMANNSAHASQSQHAQYTQSYPQQQQQAAYGSNPAAAAAAHQSSYPTQPAPSASSAVASVPGASSAAAVAGSAPAGSAPLMHWILPPDRRKLPGTRYQKVRTLRKTLFGKVSLYFDTQTQKRVAIKFSNKELLLAGKTTSGNQVAENPLEELRFLRILSRQNEADAMQGKPQQVIHPGQNHVLQLLDECEDETNLLTVLEFCGKVRDARATCVI